MIMRVKQRQGPSCGAQESVRGSPVNANALPGAGASRQLFQEDDLHGFGAQGVEVDGRVAPAHGPTAAAASPRKRPSPCCSERACTRVMIWCWGAAAVRGGSGGRRSGSARAKARRARHLALHVICSCPCATLRPECAPSVEPLGQAALTSSGVLRRQRRFAGCSIGKAQGVFATISPGGPAAPAASGARIDCNIPPACCFMAP